MHQPPTIPEGDEENEGIEQVTEGTRFPHSGAQQQPPPIHDTTTTAAELQVREDEGVGYGETPILESEIIAVSDNVTTEGEQQAENEEPSSVEKPITDDEAEVGAQPASDAENEIQGQLDEEGTLAGIKEEEGAIDESATISDAEKPLTTVAESPIPPADESLIATPHVSTDENIKPDEITPVSNEFSILINDITVCFIYFF
ncbi:unnamed protein product [Rotaria sp. Silwood1]|nr:unnamed protein product [Rotaria sp. Silwood1]CAF4685925.1 unnamed protein product [Rotaria sp. Silwood1]